MTGAFSRTHEDRVFNETLPTPVSIYEQTVPPSLTDNHSSNSYIQTRLQTQRVWNTIRTGDAHGSFHTS